MEFYVIKSDRDLAGAAQIKEHPREVLDLIKGYKFRKAISLTDKFPSLPGYHMNPEYPDNRLLTDFQDNAHGLLILSKTFADLVKEIQQNQLEFLPIKIIDHRGKTASDTYCLLNIIGTTDCLDRDASDYKLSAMDSDKIFSINKMVLKTDHIPAGTHIFRLHGMSELFLVSGYLRDKVVEQKLTGMKFIPIDQFEGS